MSNKSKWIKAIGVAATVIGVGVNLITDWVNEQKMDEKIEEKVSEALARRDKDEAEESNKALSLFSFGGDKWNRRLKEPFILYVMLSQQCPWFSVDITLSRRVI